MSHPAAASLTRLEILVDGAIAALAAGEEVDHAAMAEAKGRALLELSRHDPLRGTDDDPGLAASVGRLRAKLAEEERLLGIRLRAAEMVSGIVAEAILAAEADGTYGPRPPAPATPAGRSRSVGEGGA